MSVRVNGQQVVTADYSMEPHDAVGLFRADYPHADVGSVVTDDGNELLVVGVCDYCACGIVIFDNEHYISDGEGFVWHRDLDQRCKVDK